MSLDIPKDRRRRRTRAAVLDAAADLFARDGYRATSVEVLAQRADVALSSVYSNFPGGKADVYAALACRTADDHADGMRGAVEGKSGADRAAAAFDAYVRFHHDNPLAFRLLGLADVDGSDPTDALRDARERINRVLRSVAADMADPADRGATEGVYLGWAAVNGILALRTRGLVDESSAERLLARARTELVR
ncbi:TetR/AcrR family transcriptional regulator [Rhodococcus sp. HNM0569]|uniref:TetR/AcrR family transcriptional regulator n=1 Tax=Rhodococcus sp. HNM0569 TaxID=2716340 RepID=UPI00146C93DE|nr:TetR/AcrR family transcriptional regulator [Rhodococcus sp. HNM0569]NLU82385.1 TetR/AcrR family transcriptional regulator [Rhodococcus sp. HNM0569]